MPISLIVCTPADAETVSLVSAQAFRETFAERNTPENLDAYISATYAPSVLTTELADPRSTFFLVRVGNLEAGYLKLNIDGAQTEDQGPNSLEIQRIYILKKFKRHGIGTLLIHRALDEAAANGKDRLWLGVWENNDAALAFYTHLGFQRFGSHTFTIGTSDQTDFLMERPTHLTAEDNPDVDPQH